MSDTSTSAGAFFAQAFETQCREAVQRKLDATSSFKKTLAGIVTLQDAQAKGYAPSDAQIAAIAASIRDVADSAYALPAFCIQEVDVASGQLVQAIELRIKPLNARWREAKQFSFDTKDLADMMEEARAMVAAAHGKFVMAKA